MGDEVLEEWVSDLCIALGIEDQVAGVDGVDVDAILDLARDVAHDIERRAAPVTTFLVGLAAGRAGGSDPVGPAVATAAQLLRQRASG